MVISPFVTASALDGLQETTSEGVALLSRPEELDQLATAPPFATTFVMNERAETENGDDDVGRGRLVGLHAKVLITKEGWDSRFYVGSANATSAGMGGKGKGPRNVEFMAELKGKTSQVRGIEHFLSDDGMLPLLYPWERNPAVAKDPDELAAEEALDAAHAALISKDAGLRLKFRSDGELWRPALHARKWPALEGLDSARGRLVSMHPGAAVSLVAAEPSQAVVLNECELAACTSFLALELVAARAPKTLAFVLALPHEGLPDDRDAHIVRTMIRDEQRFLAYVLAILGIEKPEDASALPQDDADGSGTSANGFGDVLSSGMLERLIRAKARDPLALDEIQSIVAELQSTKEGQKLIPPSFLHVWEVLRATETP
jgi:hypothetical protein